MRNKKQLLSTILRLEILEDRTVLSGLVPGGASLFTGPTVSAPTSLHQPTTNVSDPDAADDLAISQKEQSSDPYSAGAPVEATNISSGSVAAHAEETAGALWLPEDGDLRGDLDMHPDSSSRDPRPGNGPIPQDERTDAEAATVLTGVPTGQHGNVHEHRWPMDLPSAGTVFPIDSELTAEHVSPESMRLEISRHEDGLDSVFEHHGVVEASSSASATEALVQSLASHTSPGEADLLTGALPADTPGLELALQQFFARLGSDRPEHDVQGVKKETKWSYWAVGTVMTGLTALEFSVRQGKRDLARRRQLRDLKRWSGPSTLGASTFILPTDG